MKNIEQTLNNALNFSPIENWASNKYKKKRMQYIRLLKQINSEIVFALNKLLKCLTKLQLTMKALSFNDWLLYF